MTTTPGTKFPWHHLAIALVVTVLYVALTYKLAVADAHRRYGTADASMVSPYIQGQFLAAFFFPIVVSGIACIPKGRNKGRILKSYWITCAILLGIHLSGAIQQLR